MKWNLRWKVKPRNQYTHRNRYNIKKAKWKIDKQGVQWKVQKCFTSVPWLLSIRKRIWEIMHVNQILIVRLCREWARMIWESLSKLKIHDQETNIRLQCSYKFDRKLDVSTKQPMKTGNQQPIDWEMSSFRYRFALTCQTEGIDMFFRIKVIVTEPSVCWCFLHAISSFHYQAQPSTT